MDSLFTAALLWAAVASGDFEVTVGENVRVSRDETPYVEPFVAGYPEGGGRLIGAATRFAGSKPATAVAFVSSDGGATWDETLLPTGPLDHAVDCWVAVSEDGTAYASVLVIEPGEKKTRISLFRSEDGGRSWTRAMTIAAEGSFDRPTLIARGKDVVVAAEHRDGLALLHSHDGARTFGPPRLLKPSRNLGHNAMNPLWRGSSIAVPYVDFGETLGSSRLGIVETGDWGKTWSAPAVVVDVPRRMPGNAHFAASGNAVYAAFASGTDDARTVSVVRSSDGEKWAQPARVSNAGAQAFRPAVAVSSRGHVGVTWLEPESGCTRVWFSVSTDGARTFGKAVPVSEELSCGDTPANRAAFERWEQGGDYFGLTADGESFVAMWPDARLGTFQIYAARITMTATAATE